MQLMKSLLTTACFECSMTWPWVSFGRRVQRRRDCVDLSFPRGVDARLFPPRSLSFLACQQEEIIGLRESVLPSPSNVHKLPIFRAWNYARMI